MINIFKGLETYVVGKKKVRLLHQDISLFNILISISKGDKIYLDNIKFVFIQKNTQWVRAQKHDSVFTGLFNLDLVYK